MGCSVHRVLVLGRVGDRRDDVPVLDEFTVLHSKNVDADVAVRADEARPMRVDGDDVAISDDAAASGRREKRPSSAIAPKWVL